MRTVYFPEEARVGPPRTAVVNVSPLLRRAGHSLRRAGPSRTERPSPGAAGRAAGRFLIAVLDTVPLALPMPRDPRAVRVAGAVRRDPSGSGRATVAALARKAGVGPRTVERLFLAETGMTFGAWRRQARLQHALVLAGAGHGGGQCRGRGRLRQRERIRRQLPRDAGHDAEPRLRGGARAMTVKVGDVRPGKDLHDGGRRGVRAHLGRRRPASPRARRTRPPRGSWPADRNAADEAGRRCRLLGAGHGVRVLAARLHGRHDPVLAPRPRRRARGTAVFA